MFRDAVGLIIANQEKVESAMRGKNPNQYTKDLRKALRMKAWNSRPSRFTADTWFSFAIKNIERKRTLAKQSMVLYAISQARQRGILDGSLEMALRKMTGWKLSAMVGRFCEACETHDQVIQAVRGERDNIVAMQNNTK